MSFDQVEYSRSENCGAVSRSVDVVKMYFIDFKLFLRLNITYCSGITI
jgi:hypothetical protein